MRKAQINIVAVVGVAFGIISSAFGWGMYTINRFGAVEQHNAILQSKYERVEADISEIKSDIKEIKNVLIRPALKVASSTITNTKLNGNN